MLEIVLARYVVRAWLNRARTTKEPVGLEALFTVSESSCPIPLKGCQRCVPEPTTDHRDVGRGDLSKESISDVVRWLEREGWYGEDAGRLQVYAAWLIKRRASYERGAEVPS
jgi:hypothetical protein